jgi:NAD(P)-dependent dehydrogenase (short-subunit alcohol dehydrogenase family)
MTDTLSRPLENRVALVTGASRGLGAASAEWLASRGAHVVAVARTVGGLEELDDRIQAAGGHATLAPMDLTDDNAIAHLCRSIHDRWGKADIWVHTAIHVTALTPAPHIQVKDLDRVLATNIRMLARLIANVEPLIAPAEAPQAVFFDDAWDEKFAGAYAMSKAAQRALVESWAAESAKHGPKVHLLRPEPMPTAVRARFYPGEDKAALSAPRDEAARLLAPLFAGA